MTEHIRSFWRPLLVVMALMLMATPVFSASNQNFSMARDIDPYLREVQPDKTELSQSSTTSSRLDADGHLVVYVVEPTGRWLDNGQSFPPAAPKPFGNAVIGYAFDQEVYIDESFDLTMDWDAAAAGFGDITEDNIKVVAAYFQTEAVPTIFDVPGGSNLHFDAHYLMAAAEATPGNPGSNYSDGDYTHTVFIDEAAATW